MCVELCVVWDEALPEVCLKLSSAEENTADAVKLKLETVRFDQNTV